VSRMFFMSVQPPNEFRRFVFGPYQYNRQYLAELIVSNAIPILGVVIFRWEVLPILTIYFIEFLIFGIFRFIALMRSFSDTLPYKMAKLGFFIIHISFFVGPMFMITMFVGSIVSEGDQTYLFRSILTIPFVLSALFLIANCCISQIIRNKHKNKSEQVRYKKTNEGETAAFNFYGKQFIVYIIGAIGLSLKSPVWALIILLGLKLLFDLSAYRKEILKKSLQAAHFRQN
jgi:hypothetical protein